LFGGCDVKNLDEITPRLVGLVALFALLFTSARANAELKFATGLSGQTNAGAAAAECAAEMKAKLGSTVPDLIIISEDMQISSITPVVNAIATQFPGVPVYGRGDFWEVYDPYTEDGIIGPLNPDTVKSMGMVALCGVGYEAHYITGVDSTSGSSTLTAKGTELANLINPLPADTKVVILFGDLHASATTPFVNGMISVLGNTFPLLEGSSNDWTPYVYHEGLRVTDPAQAILLKGNFGVSFAFAPGNDHSPAAEGAAAQRALDAVPAGMEPKLMLWFNCNSRRDTADLQAHMAAVQAVIGTELPLFGAYSGGEACKPDSTPTSVISAGTGRGVFGLIYEIASPTITPNGGGTYIDPVTVTISISSPGPGASIRYTTDGSDPNENSALYTGQLVLTTDTTIKARSYAGGQSSSVKTAVFTINTSLANQAPQVDAGPSLRLGMLGDSGQLAGVVSDQTLPYPPGEVTASWSVISGPATVTFDDANSSTTRVTMSAAGHYTLRLTADDGEFAVYDDVHVFVPTPLPVNVVNPSFELDLTGQPNQTKRDLEEVLGWLEGLDNGSGVETILYPGDPTKDFTGTGDGFMKAFGKWDQASGQGDWWYQILNHPIGAGKHYRMVFAYGVNSADTPVIASFIDGSTMADLASTTVTMSTRFVFVDYTLDLTVPNDAGYIGHNLGIKFRIGSRSQASDGWASVDNIRLQYVPVDLTGNSVVDEGDLKELTDQWLWSGTAGAIPEDMVADGYVDVVDYAYLAEQWLAGQ
jgi:hypothetical protein